MAERKTPRVYNVTAQHPDRGDRPESVIQMTVDRGLKSRKLDIIEIDPEEAVHLAEQLLNSRAIVLKANRRRGG